jgi:signal transduction histidine kinase/DNA-binding response OmpR family regulator
MSHQHLLNIFENNNDPYLIIKIAKQKISKEDIGYFELYKIFNWGQLKLSSQSNTINILYPDLFKYNNIIAAIIELVNNKNTGFIKDVKLNDSHISKIVNVSITSFTHSLHYFVLISTSKSEMIEFNGKFLLPAQILDMRNNFTSSVGHELRTPLTSISSMIELLELTKTDAKQSDYISFLKTSCSQLISIVNDIMDYSKLEDNKVRLDNNPTNLRKCIESAFSIVAADFSNISIEYISNIQDSCPLDVLGDDVKIIQILINLVKNSVKFSPDNSKVIVKLRSVGESIHGDLARHKFLFEVIDEGIGISKEDIGKLFVPYSQLNQEYARKKHGGTGLGLIISKKICNLMGGTITVESEVGKGTTFSFSLILEINKSPIVSIHNNTEFISLIRGKNILVVDDTEAHRITLGQIIHSWGATCTMCSTPREALAMVEIGVYHLGILDYSMPPNMNGRELALEIKKRSHSFPLIVLSSLNENIEGPFNLLFKPIRKDRLEDTIKTIFTPIMSSMSPSFTIGQQTMRSITPVPATPRNRTNSRSNSGQLNKSDRILVVDDYEAIKYGIIESLHYIGYTNVDSTDNGKDALRMVIKAKNEKDDYKFIFMDIVMPIMDGVTAVIEINKVYQSARPMIIALTANASSGDEQKYLLVENGRFDKYMSKPTTIKKIAEIIRSF